MGGMGRGEVHSCYECAAQHYCEDRQFDTAEARKAARACRQVFKGRPGDVVVIRGYSKKISLGRALQIVSSGMAVWSDDGDLYLQGAELRVGRKRSKVLPLIERPTN